MPNNNSILILIFPKSRFKIYYAFENNASDIYVTVGMVRTGPLACLSPFAIMSVDKSHLLHLQV